MERGGFPSKGTPKDGRLKKNQAPKAKPQPKAKPKPKPPRP